MPTRMPELLCPAGDEAALRAAVDCGANAVYLGYKAFGARASAINFDAETLERAVRYAHFYHTKVFVTVNTLIKPGEVADVHEALCVIQATGADAVLVQDMGVADMILHDFPHLQLHASTQMGICNAEGARLAKRLGFDRVVLARECSLAEVRNACQTGIEIEVFAHGALCTAVSGRCLMSSLSGGRSGNRGRCAQPCRQCFALGQQEGALLSMRDLCLLDELPALCEAGVASLKIEGRLKSPEYVAVVTQVYRKALDDIEHGTFHPGDVHEKEKLLQIYNRGGFTRGHMVCAEDAELTTPGRVSHEGVMLGTVLSVRRNLATIRLERDLHDGDSLQLRGREDIDLRYSGYDTPVGQTATIHLRPGVSAEPGMQVARLSDAPQLEAARAHQPKPIPVTMQAHFALGKPMELSVSDAEVSVTVQGAVVETAQTRASTAEDARKQLEKLGNTRFVLAKPMQINTGEGLFLPVSALNALRRDAMKALEEARIFAFSTPVPTKQIALSYERPLYAADTHETLAVIFSQPYLAQPLKESGATWLMYAPRTFSPDALDADLAHLPDGTWLRLPPQMSEKTLHGAVSVLNRHANKLGGIVAESVAQLGLPVALPLWAGEGIPATNRECMAFLQQTGLSGFTLWPEWTYQEQRALMLSPLPCLLKVYGREQLMLLNHCPERVRLGLSANRSTCRLCKTTNMVCGRENAVLTDRKGYAFPLSRTRFAEGCEIQVLGALPTDLRTQDEARRALGAGMLLHFTVESAQLQMELTKQFAALLKGQPIPAAAQPTTTGHWLRGVE